MYLRTQERGLGASAKKLSLLRLGLGALTLVGLVGVPKNFVLLIALMKGGKVIEIEDAPASIREKISNNGDAVNNDDYSTSRHSDRRLVPRTSLPYNCGVVFFYHIPCTGGTSIERWLSQFQEAENISRYSKWEIETRNDGSWHPDPKGFEARFKRGMEKFIQNIKPKEWKFAHSHLTSIYLNESEDALNRWRDVVESQGCQLINTVMLRDPLNHAMALYKILNSKNSTREDWTAYLQSPTGTGKWSTVLDFFLYNTHGNRRNDDYPGGAAGGRNPYNVTKEVKVARAMELLHRHFDIVTVANHQVFHDTVLEWTGWKDLPMPRTNTHGGTLQFTKKEVEKLQKLLAMNGDIDFVDRVKQEYHGYLTYLD